jgi:DNA polymerase-3 subunit alpha
MAALVEDLRWRDTRRGGRYVSATFSDNSGQFQASCFDEDGCKLLERLSGDGECALLTVELDRLPGEETPRVTVRGVAPLSRLADNARMRMVVVVEQQGAFGPLSAVLEDRRGARSELVLHLRLADGSLASLQLGQNFLLDAELGERIEAIAGVSAVTLVPIESLRLVASR